MLKQFKEPVVMRGTDDPHFTMVSIQGKKKDEQDRPIWTEQLSIIDWCNRYHKPDDPDFNTLEESKVVPAEIVLRFRKRSASSVPEHVKIKSALFDLQILMLFLRCTHVPQLP